jgi:hypothetical protein
MFAVIKISIIEADVIHKISTWEEIFQSCGVPDKETSTLQENIRVAFKRLTEITQ